MIRFENSRTHDCNNVICQLLNPSLERLLEYEDLRKRITKAEEIFFEDIDRMDIAKSVIKSFPLGLFGWASAHHVFQLLNIEFIRELAYKIKEIDPEIILEVGSGEGLLGKYLSKELEKEIILTDDYSWWEKENVKIENKYVIRMDYKDAIKKYNPNFIIASWIPYKRWWTKDFMECDSVKGYILIGEGPGGCTGNDMDWKTPWIIHNLDDIEMFGICRTDYGFHNKGYYNIRHTNISLFERPDLNQ